MGGALDAPALVAVVVAVVVSAVEAGVLTEAGRTIL